MLVAFTIASHASRSGGLNLVKHLLSYKRSAPRRAVRTMTCLFQRSCHFFLALNPIILNSSFLGIPQARSFLLLCWYFLTFYSILLFRFPKPIKSSGCLFFSDMLCSHLQSSLMSALAQDWKQQPLVNTGAKNITFPRWNNLFTLDWRFLSLSLFSKATLNISRSVPLTLMRQLHTDPGSRTSNALSINVFT